MDIEIRNNILKELRDLCSSVETGGTNLEGCDVRYECIPGPISKDMMACEPLYTGRRTMTITYTIPSTRDPRLGGKP